MSIQTKTIINISYHLDFSKVSLYRREFTFAPQGFVVKTWTTDKENAAGERKRKFGRENGERRHARKSTAAVYVRWPVLMFVFFAGVYTLQMS